jgi:hypothetical protein
LEGVGNTGECDVARALRHMAANALRIEFARVDQAAAALEAARRRDERTYLTDPRLPPRFSDEPGDFHLDTPRTAEQLAAAEERLRELGFAAEADGNVVAWKYRQEPSTVLADPRAAGRLRFRVYDETRIAAARRKGGRRLGSWASAFSVPLLAEFYLLDSWRNDIVGKFRAGCSRRLQPSTGKARRVIAATNDHWHRDANGGNVGQRNE